MEVLLSLEECGAVAAMRTVLLGQNLGSNPSRRAGLHGAVPPLPMSLFSHSYKAWLYNWKEDLLGKGHN